MSNDDSKRVDECAVSGGCVLPKTPGVNDDLAAFGEIVSGPPLGGIATLRLATRAPSAVESALRCRESEIAAAHEACDSSVRRDDGQRAYSLADRIKGMRRMIDDYQCWLADAEQLLKKAPMVHSGVDLIVAFFSGALTIAFLLWIFRALP